MRRGAASRVWGAACSRRVPISYRAEDELIVGGARHKVDPARPPAVGDERQVAELVVDVLVPHLDPRRQRLGRQLDADRRVQLVEPRARRVDHAPRADDRAVLHPHADAARAVGRRLERLDALVEADVDPVAAARGEQVGEAGARVEVAAAVLVHGREGAVVRRHLVALVVEGGERLGRDVREAVRELALVDQVGGDPKLLEPRLHRRVLRRVVPARSGGGRGWGQGGRDGQAWRGGGAHPSIQRAPVSVKYASAFSS